MPIKGKISMKERILTPSYKYVFNYKGPAVDRSLRLIPKLTKNSFGISSKDWRTTDFKWDIFDDKERSFFANYWANFKLMNGDGWSKGRIEVTHWGAFNKDTGEGHFKLIIIPVLEVSFVYNNPFQKFLYHTWHAMFYNRQKRKYVEYIKEKFNNYVKSLKEIYKLGVVEE